ncbi:hypothetical protein [Bartonella sp. OD88NMGDW]
MWLLKSREGFGAVEEKRVPMEGLDCKMRQNWNGGMEGSLVKMAGGK